MTGFYMITASVMKELTEEHDKMLNDSITATHKNADATHKNASDNVKKKINANGKQVFRNRIVLEWMPTNGGNNCFMSLKDQKENVQNNPTARLINPAKKQNSGKQAKLF